MGVSDDCAVALVVLGGLLATDVVGIFRRLLALSIEGYWRFR